MDGKDLAIRHHPLLDDSQAYEAGGTGMKEVAPYLEDLARESAASKRKDCVSEASPNLLDC